MKINVRYFHTRIENGIFNLCNKDMSSIQFEFFEFEVHFNDHFTGT